MIGNYFSLPKYNWNIKVFYDVKKHDIDFCIKELNHLTTKSKHHDKCYNTLYTNKKDKGYIYTSYNKLETIIFIGVPSSTGELIDTIGHEANHLKSHIATYYDIDEKGEEAAYLAGEIVQQMTEAFIKLIYYKPLDI